jgi:carbohydrate-binding DOMON domain-containing protein
MHVHVKLANSHLYMYIAMYMHVPEILSISNHNIIILIIMLLKTTCSHADVRILNIIITLLLAPVQHHAYTLWKMETRTYTHTCTLFISLVVLKKWVNWQ